MVKGRLSCGHTGPGKGVSSLSVFRTRDAWGGGNGPGGYFEALSLIGMAAFVVKSQSAPHMDGDVGYDRLERLGCTSPHGPAQAHPGPPWVSQEGPALLAVLK